MRYLEAIQFIENVPPFELPINGIREIDKVIEHYESQGYTCEVLPDDEYYVRKMKVQ